VSRPHLQAALPWVLAGLAAAAGGDESSWDADQGSAPLGGKTHPGAELLGGGDAAGALLAAVCEALRDSAGAPVAAHRSPCVVPPG